MERGIFHKIQIIDHINKRNYSKEQYRNNNGNILLILNQNENKNDKLLQSVVNKDNNNTHLFGDIDSIFQIKDGNNNNKK